MRSLYSETAADIGMEPDSMPPTDRTPPMRTISSCTARAVSARPRGSPVSRRRSK